MISILVAVVSLAFVVLTALIDAEMILEEHYIDSHRSRWSQRVCFFLAMGMVQPEYFFASALLFSALFDQVLNSMRMLPFWYLGTVAKWDLFFSKRKWLYVAMKITTLILAALLFTFKYSDLQLIVSQYYF